jgi:hypothetical protein
MNKLLIATLVLTLAGCSSALKMRESNDFSASQMGMRDSYITWRVVDDAAAECKKLGSEPGALACALMGKYNCVIITSKNTTHEILGHEARHCFEGNFH